ncbi:DUF418 domain-containing protein [Nesterenkonia sp. Hz 6-5]|nr:DUF418 domain-containing protein [Nesterenkonia haasae]
MSPRVNAVDALRTLALLGILSVNIWFFAHPDMLTTGMRGNPDESAADQLVRFGASLIFEGKSYVLFSFLFGLSFVFAWARAFESGSSETRRSVRRFTALIVLGLLHGLFLFAGDILLAYGILGFLLLGMRRISTRAALLTAGVIYTLMVLVLVVLGMVTMALEDTMGQAMLTLGESQDAVAAYTGSVTQWFAFQVAAYPVALVSVLFVQGPLAFAAFLAGLVVGRARLVERIVAGEFSTRRLLSIGLPTLGVGLALSSIAALLTWGQPGRTDYEPGQGAQLLGTAVNLAAGPIQTFGYIVLLLVLFRSAEKLTVVLAPAGRMSLTNYLGQSLIMLVLFSGVGFGLGGQLSEVAVGGVVLGIWLTQLALSHLWFMRFQRGPVEMPFRTWSYRGT